VCFCYIEQGSQGNDPCVTRTVITNGHSKFVTLPQHVYSSMLSYISYIGHLQDCHDHWDKAETAITSNQGGHRCSLVLWVVRLFCRTFLAHTVIMLMSAVIWNSCWFVYCSNLSNSYCVSFALYQQYNLLMRISKTRGFNCPPNTNIARELH